MVEKDLDMIPMIHMEGKALNMILTIPTLLQEKAQNMILMIPMLDVKDLVIPMLVARVRTMITNAVVMVVIVKTLILTILVLVEKKVKMLDNVKEDVEVQVVCEEVMKIQVPMTLMMSLEQVEKAVETTTVKE